MELDQNVLHTQLLHLATLYCLFSVIKSTHFMHTLSEICRSWYWKIIDMNLVTYIF